MADRAHVETICQKLKIWDLTLTTLQAEIKRIENTPHPNAVSLQIARLTEITIKEKLDALKKYQQKLDRT